MKKIYGILTATLALILIAGCRRDDAGFDRTPDAQTETVGYLSFAGDPVSVLWEGENITRAEAAAAPDVDSFTVEIVDAATGEKVDTGCTTYGDYKALQKNIAMPLGTYYIDVYSGETADTAYEGTEGQPTYGTRSADFDIRESHTDEEPQTVGQLTCKLLSVKTTVSLEESFAAKCRNMEIEVILSHNGQSRSVSFNDGERHYGIVGMDETFESVTEEFTKPTAGYLKPFVTENTLSLKIKGDFEGEASETEELQEIETEYVISSSVKAGQWRNITLFVQGDEPQGGKIVIGARIETWLYDEEVRVEAGELATLYSEDSIPDIDDPMAPRIVAPNFTFDDITYITAADYDTMGEYTGNATIEVTTTAQTTRFAVRMSSDNADFRSALSGLGLLDTSIDLIDNSNSSTLTARTMLKNWGFPSRDAIEDNPTHTVFKINDFFKFIKDFEGNHTVILGVTSEGGYYSRADLEINVSREGTSIDPTVDPNIWWPGHDMELYYDVINGTPKDGQPVKVYISANNGIKSLRVKLSGAIEAGLADVRLPSEFDLVDPNATQEGLDQFLGYGGGEGLGFPIEDDVRNKEYLEFDISGFMTMLALFEGKTEFTLTVTDNNEQSITKAIKLNMVNQ